MGRIANYLIKHGKGDIEPWLARFIEKRMREKSKKTKKINFDFSHMDSIFRRLGQDTFEGGDK